MFSWFNKKEDFISKSTFETCIDSKRCPLKVLDKLYKESGWNKAKAISNNKLNIFKYIIEIQKEKSDFLDLSAIIQKDNIPFFKYLSDNTVIGKHDYYDCLNLCIVSNKINFFEFIINDLKKKNKLSTINLNPLIMKAWLL